MHVKKIAATQHSQDNPEEHQSNGITHISWFQIYCMSTVINTVYYVDRYIDEQNIIKSSEIVPYVLDKLIFWQVYQNHSMWNK